MTLEDVHTLLAADVARILGVAVSVQPATGDSHAYLVAGTSKVALTYYEVSDILAEIDKAATPIKADRLSAAALIVALFSGLLINDAIVARANAIGAVVQLHAERYAERLRKCMADAEGGAS